MIIRISNALQELRYQVLYDRDGYLNGFVNNQSVILRSVMRNPSRNRIPPITIEITEPLSETTWIDNYVKHRIVHAISFDTRIVTIWSYFRDLVDSCNVQMCNMIITYITHLIMTVKASGMHQNRFV